VAKAKSYGRNSGCTSHCNLITTGRTTRGTSWNAMKGVPSRSTYPRPTGLAFPQCCLKRPVPGCRRRARRILSAASTVNRVATCIRSPFPRACLLLRQTQPGYRQPPAQIALGASRVSGCLEQNLRTRSTVDAAQTRPGTADGQRSLRDGPAGASGPPLPRYSWAVNVAPARERARRVPPAPAGVSRPGEPEFASVPTVSLTGGSRASSLGSVEVRRNLLLLRVQLGQFPQPAVPLRTSGAPRRWRRCTADVISGNRPERQPRVTL
jgi:hypothetical protein